MDVAITAPIPPTQMPTDAVWGRSGIGIVTIIQHHQLDVAKDGFDRLVIGTPLRQRNPVHL